MHEYISSTKLKQIIIRCVGLQQPSINRNVVKITLSILQ